MTLFCILYLITLMCLLSLFFILSEVKLRKIETEIAVIRNKNLDLINEFYNLIEK